MYREKALYSKEETVMKKSIVLLLALFILLTLGASTVLAGDNGPTPGVESSSGACAVPATNNSAIST
jgi:hypothetical protein